MTERFRIFKPKPQAAEPYEPKPFIINVDGKPITLITKERVNEIHEEALRAAEQIRRNSKTLLDDDLLFIRCLVTGLITGGKLEGPSRREKR